MSLAPLNLVSAHRWQRVTFTAAKADGPWRRALRVKAAGADG